MPSLYPPGHALHPVSLKEKQRGVRDHFAPPLALRVHRALSWVTRAEREDGDDDVRFILLWIGFNAAYATHMDRPDENERALFHSFFATLVRFDSKHRIYDAVWKRFSQEIRVLLDNQYVFHPFWAHHNGMPGNEDWAQKLERSRLSVGYALREHDTAKILAILFDRLYVLRNQLVHGGATWNSEVNRGQVGVGAAVLSCLLPVFIDLMMDNPDEKWPMPHYPVVQ